MKVKRDKYLVRKCLCVGECTGIWIATDSSGYRTFWATWERAMLRATKEY